MINDDDTGSARPIIHVPMTTEEFAPPKPVENFLLGLAFVKKFWTAELYPYYAAMGGEGRPIAHNPKGDEWYLTKHAKGLAADHEEFAPLANLNDDEFRLLMRRCVKRHAGFPVGALVHQGVRVKIEDKRARKGAPPDNDPEPQADAAE